MKNHHGSIGKHVGLMLILLIFSAQARLSLGIARVSDPMHFDSFGSRTAIHLTQVSEDPRDPKKGEDPGKNNKIDASDGKPSAEQSSPEGQPAQQKKKKTYKTFSPSERIDVDQAVDFPADI